MASLKRLIPAAAVSLFFFAYVFAGYLLYRDYGVTTDEPADYLRGMANYQRFMGGSLVQFQADCATMQNENVCYYPPFFSMALYRFAPYDNIGPILLKGYWKGWTTNTQSTYYQRHKLTFAFFAFSVFIFFLIGKKIFKDWKIGLLGALFLIISPRIFAYSFYNPKDIPFLSAYVISIYTMLLFLDKKNILTSILHGIATAVVCSIRTPGIIILPITIFFYTFDLFLSRAVWKTYLKGAGLLLSFLLVSIGLFYWFNPSLYTDPIANYINTFNIMRQYPWKGSQYYMGRDINNQVPWHYSIVWFSISSPVFYLVLFVTGMATLLAQTVKARLRTHFQAMRDLYLVSACAILPIVVVIVEKSILYTNNRQMYFVYPPLLLISLYGFVKLVELLRKKFVHWQVWAAAILILGLAYPVYFMVRYHPYENFYFNFLAGSKMSAIKGRFTFDSWMTPSKEALEYILRTDTTKHLTINFLDGTPRSLFILPKADQARLTIKSVNLPLSPDDNPMYIVDEYHFYPHEQVPGGSVYYSIKIGDTDILTVYKMNQ
jgi:hypothetical protein